MPMFFRDKHQRHAVKFKYSREEKSVSFVANLITFLKGIFYVVTFFVLGLSILLWTKRSNFPVEKIKIIARYEHVSPKILQDIVSSFVQRSFFDVDVVNLQRKLLQIPWIYGVSIQRQWPNTLLIDVREQAPVARWKKYALLNTYGQVFTPPEESFPSSLPILSGPDEKAAQIFHDYQIMQKTLNQLRFKIAQIELDASSSWNIVLDNGLILYLNSEAYFGQLENFVKVYPRIVNTNPGGKMHVIDLRYSNGAAVKWE